MIYDETIHRYRLSTGRTFGGGANRAIGINDRELSVGYDQMLDCVDFSDDLNDDTNLTEAEKIEIAEYMIEKWTEFKDSLK